MILSERLLFFLCRKERKAVTGQDDLASKK